MSEAIQIAKSGRPGPVWIDIPINVQGALIEDNLVDLKIEDENSIKNIDDEILQVIDYLKSAKRPVIVAGHGIRIAKQIPVFHQLVKKLQIPVLTTFNGFDLIESDDEMFFGRIGTIGQRAGNFVLQNADVVLFLGTRNNIRQISYNWEMYARKAKKIAVDIDEAELKKPTIKLDLAINADLKDFFAIFFKILTKNKIIPKNDWINWCKVRKEKYNPKNTKEYFESFGRINPYEFIIKMTSAMKKNDVLVAGNGTACVALFQAGTVKKNQRIFWNSGDASMGYDLPAAIGACFANDKKNVICLAGDGSIMMNIQELQTVKHYNLPIKIFVLNNAGYSSIRQTQRNFFGEKFVACSADSGISMPDFAKVAKAFGIKSVKIEKSDDIEKKVAQVLRKKGPILCEVLLDYDYIFQPKLSSEKLPDGRIISKPLEDMFPFLPRDEFESNIIE